MAKGRKRKTNRLPSLLQNRKVIFISLLLGAAVLTGIYLSTDVGFVAYSSFTLGRVYFVGIDTLDNNMCVEAKYFTICGMSGGYQPFVELTNIEFVPFSGSSVYTVTTEVWVSDNGGGLISLKFDDAGYSMVADANGVYSFQSGDQALYAYGMWTVILTFEDGSGGTTELTVRTMGATPAGSAPLITQIVYEPLEPGDITVTATISSDLEIVEVRTTLVIGKDEGNNYYFFVPEKYSYIDGTIVKSGNDYSFVLEDVLPDITVTFWLRAYDISGRQHTDTGAGFTTGNVDPVFNSLSATEQVDGGWLIEANVWDDHPEGAVVYTHWKRTIGGQTFSPSSIVMERSGDNFAVTIGPFDEGTSVEYWILIYDRVSHGPWEQSHQTFEVGNEPPIIIDGLGIDGLIFEYGDTTQYDYTFRAIDAEPGPFGIESSIDGMLFGGGHWLSNFDMPFYFSPKHGLDYWSAGIHTITLWVEDADGARAEEIYTITISDSVAPMISQPEDIDYEKLTPNFFPEIIWSVSDESHGYFEIYRNNDLFDTYDWVYHTQVRVPVWEWPAGIYSVVLIAYDGNGNSAQDTVGVTITGDSGGEDTAPPSIAGPADESYEFGSTGNKIVWQVGDENPAFYIITVDGDEVISGSWDGSDIEHNLNGLAVGSYTFQIELEDVNGLVSDDTVVITIYEKGGEPTTEPALVDDTSGMLIIGVVIVIICIGSGKQKR